MLPATIDWSRIDTVLLDMDGTLLDLRFDNWFWQDLLPRAYASARGLREAEAVAILRLKFRQRRGTLEWYCIDYWSRELALDIAALKFAARNQVAYLPGAREFLETLKTAGKRRVLVTNAHPRTLEMKEKQVALATHVDVLYSSHDFDLPKEHRHFWPRLQAAEPFDPERTLMIDDSLAVLDAARGFGIRWLRAIRRPDSGQPPQSTEPFEAIDGIADLLA